MLSGWDAVNVVLEKHKNSCRTNCWDCTKPFFVTEYWNQILAGTDQIALILSHKQVKFRCQVRMIEYWKMCLQISTGPVTGTVSSKVFAKFLEPSFSTTERAWRSFRQGCQTDPVKGRCGCRFSFQPSKSTPDPNQVCFIPTKQEHTWIGSGVFLLGWNENLQPQLPFTGSVRRHCFRASCNIHRSWGIT